MSDKPATLETVRDTCDRIIAIAVDTQAKLQQNDRDLQACVDRLRQPIKWED